MLGSLRRKTFPLTPASAIGKLRFPCLSNLCLGSRCSTRIYCSKLMAPPTRYLLLSAASGAACQPAALRCLLQITSQPFLHWRAWKSQKIQPTPLIVYFKLVSMRQIRLSAFTDSALQTIRDAQSWTWKVHPSFPLPAPGHDFSARRSGPRGKLHKQQAPQRHSQAQKPGSMN